MSSRAPYRSGGAGKVWGRDQYMASRDFYMLGGWKKPAGSIRKLPGRARDLPGSIQRVPDRTRHIESWIRYMPERTRHMPETTFYMPGRPRGVAGSPLPVKSTIRHMKPAARS